MKTQGLGIVDKDTVCVNKAMEDLSLMLWQVEPTGEFFQGRNMDFSIKSLKHVEKFLKYYKKHKENIPFNDHVKVVLRSGAYIGEVIRKHGQEKFDWLQHPAINRDKKLISNAKKGPELWNIAYLWTFPQTCVFPMNKVNRYMQYGREHSIVYFAETITKYGMKESARIHARPEDRGKF